ncbi:hypothetical protein [Pseudomonas sp. GV071]|jgi:hypothetical protein|uniref:hypothetical protein n=1 Tax=Pseudomonas sp. GV071 TaxID=2135754 RepID=UPI000D4062CC|nr:hypothetical protein [Pseudomonas sp. GV071]PTQ67027.1 hypothetical protein C8K61_1179 [Pseudomonas sp. GV071]
MSGHVGLREDTRIGERLARRIALLFVGCAARTGLYRIVSRCAQHTLRGIAPWRR